MSIAHQFVPLQAYMSQSSGSQFESCVGHTMYVFSWI